jgi:hypothetical protein
MMNRRRSGILGHPLTGTALRAGPAAGGDGLLRGDAWVQDSAELAQQRSLILI